MKIRISKNYAEKCVFDRLELEIAEGEIVCLFGASGAGKTTLLNALAGVVPFDGKIDPLPQKVGYIFQEPRLLPHLTVKENLAYVGGRDADIADILQKTELTEHAHKRPSALSGGEKQRVSIARAFLTDAPLLLLDEPFSFLDTAAKGRLIEAFVALWRERKPTVVFVTHDLEEALSFSQRILVLKGGKIVAEERVFGEIPRKYGENADLRERILHCLEK